MRFVLLIAGMSAALGAAGARAAGSAPPDSGLPADSLAGPDSTLSLPALERWVLARNPEIEAMRQALSATRARIGMEGALMDPELEISTAPGSFDEDELDPAYRIGIRQMLPWSKLGPRRAVARAEARMDSAEVERMRNDLLRMTREAYVEHVRGEASLRVVHELQGLTEQFRKTALDRYSAGLVGETDPLMAESEGARLEHDAIMNARKRDTARGRLNALLHRPWNATLPPPPATLPPAQEMPPLEVLVSWGVRLRPELAAAQAREQAGRERLRLAGRERIPDLGLMAAYDQFMLEKPYRWMVGVSVTLPLWRGRIGAGERQARAGLEQARALAAAQRDRVAFEIQAAYLRVADSAHEAEIVRDAELPVSRRALGAALAGYESGRNDLLTLLNAERELGRVRLEEIRVLAEHRMALADLEQAVGTPLPAESAGPREGGR